MYVSELQLTLLLLKLMSEKEPDIEEIINGGNTEPPEEIMAPYTYLQLIPGNNKNIRARFLKGFNDLYYNIDNHEFLDEIESIISVFHNSSLLIDDIEDNSQYRRGLVTSHIKYGTPLTINCGNLMYFIALQKSTTNLPILYAKTNPAANSKELAADILKILVDEMLNLHHGQGLDIYWRDYFTEIVEKDALPTYDQYIKMAMDKTGGLFRLSVKLLELFSSYADTHGTNIPLANLLGVIYQIRDDYLNLVDSTYSHMKGVTGEDLIEGKLSLPILHCLRSTDNLVSCPVYKILFEHRTSKERMGRLDIVDQAIEFMKTDSKSLEWTRNLLLDYAAKAKDLIAAPEGEVPFLVSIIDHLTNL